MVSAYLKPTSHFNCSGAVSICTRRDDSFKSQTIAWFVRVYSLKSLAWVLISVSSSDFGLEKSNGSTKDVLLHDLNTICFCFLLMLISARVPCLPSICRSFAFGAHSHHTVLYSLHYIYTWNIKTFVCRTKSKNRRSICLEGVTLWSKFRPGFRLRLANKEYHSIQSHEGREIEPCRTLKPRVRRPKIGLSKETNSTQ